MRKLLTFNGEWRIPAPETAFEGFYEGAPSEAEKQAILERVHKERESWAPSPVAWEIFVELAQAIGKEIEVQQWNPIMALLDDEGPYPLRAQCTGLYLSPTEDGKIQACLGLKQVRCRKTSMGYDGRGYLLKGKNRGEWLAVFGDLHSVEWDE